MKNMVTIGDLDLRGRHLDADECWLLNSGVDGLVESSAALSAAGRDKLGHASDIWHQCLYGRHG